MSERRPRALASPEAAIGIGVLAVGAGMAVGATQISSEAGYSGVGPNFLPWLVAIGLVVGGAMLLQEALTGGYRNREEPSGGERGDWRGFLWVTAGILLNAALITRIGFILSCALCFVLAVRGIKQSEGRLDLGLKSWLVDIAVGFAIAAPVFWMFTQALAINLPGLTSTGWL